MKGIVKWVGGIIFALTALVILAAVLLPNVIDPNDYREDISALVKDQTGMTLTINGEIDWSVFPWLGLSLGDLRIDDTRQKQLGTLSHAAVKVKLLPLLSKKVEISTLELSGLNLDLEVDAQGRPNWEPVQASSDSTSESSSASASSANQESQSEPATSGRLPEFDISSVAINDLNINYRDIPAKQTVAISKARLETGAVRPGKPFRLDASFDLKNSEPALSAQVKLTGQFALGKGDSKFQADKLELSVTPLGVSNPESLSLTTNMKVLTNDSITGQLKVPAVDLSQFMNQLKLPVPALTGGDKVLRKVSLGTSFRKTGNALSMDNITAALDDFMLEGNIAVTDLKKQAISFKITGNDLVVDPYLPVATQEQKSSSASPAPASTPTATNSAPQATGDEVIIPVEVIQQLNIKGTAQLASLTAKGFLFEKPTLEVKAANGSAQITKLNAGFYKGVIDGAAGVDASGRLARQPRISARADIKGIDIAALSAQVVDLKKIEGQTNTSLKVIGHGLTQNQIVRSLNGEVNFDIANGTLLGTNFNKSVCGLVARVRKEEMTKADWPKQTEFKSLKGTVKIVDGIARNRDLSAELDQLNLKGDGDVNLINQTMDYHLGLTITGDTASEEESACRINEKYANISWPLRCKGKLGDEGLCGIDEQRFGKTIGKLAEREVKDKIRKKLEDKLGDLFKKK